MELPAIQCQLVEFIERTCLVKLGVDGLTAQTDLFVSGVLDSFSAVQLSRFIERTFSLSLGDDDRASPEYATIDGIASIIARKTGAGG